ncbi:polyprenyl synthetase family protein, partial [Patescibacteria group bacterium]|nr:polyprenyl synthetase family protein [Patescibacteria group bacterium]
MDIKKFFTGFKKQIDRELTVYLDDKIREAEKQDFFTANLAKQAKKIILSGGKRLRPAFMYWGYMAGGGKEREKILKNSISIELVHNFLLMHDDIIDHGQKRHGVATLNAEYSKIGKLFFGQDGAEHFGNSMALIFGDMLSAMSNQVIFTSNFPADLIVKALKQIQAIVSQTVVGEIQDVYMDSSGKTSEEAILKMYRNKTACYTIEGPLVLGAVLAGADEKIFKVLSAYALPLGVAFQIQDDILGIFGSEKELGKEIGLDIKESKKTLLLVKALELGTREQKVFLKEILGQKAISQSEIKKFQEIMVTSRALQYV